MFKKKFRPLLILSVFCTFYLTSIAQPPTWTFEPFGKEKKPEKFETKKLGSERTADKKFKLPRRVIQNTVSHYNYYFNANNKLNAVMERATMSSQDDYAHLLPFYPYNLDNTASQKTELDSVIYKATAGILLHDLRSDWVDNLYLLIGKSFLLRKDYDSAIMTFQFINYNLFPRKKKEDDNRIVGTRDDQEGSIVSIANPEKRNIIKKMFTYAPSRNEALIWLIRSLTEQGEYGDAAGLINTLQTDPNMPKRLLPFLEEVNAYWFYKQQQFDSSANHLEKALSNAETKQDKSRWEFLLAQMMEMSGEFDKASDYYDRASKHTTDPLMDIFAKLNEAKMLRTNGDSKELDANMSKLLSMAKKDKFETYRDIIYYSVAEMALQKPDTTSAVIYLNKSIKFNENNVYYKNRAFLRLADLAYSQKRYRESFSYYDSLQVGDTSLAARITQISARRKSLAAIVEKLNIIDREDSLQNIAAMSGADREAFIKKLVKRLRKERGLKDEEVNSGTSMISFDNNKNQQADLFPASTKGEWYFNNNATKGKGFNEFKSRWGTRTNTDNWRRRAATPDLVNKGPQASVDQLTAGVIPPGKADPNNNGMVAPNKVAAALAAAGGDVSYEELMKTVPLTPEQLSLSHVLLSLNLFELAKLYQNDLEDYHEAIFTYEESLKRYPDSLYNGDLYYGLYYCYNKIGNIQQANYYKNLLTSKFANSKAAKTVTNPSQLNPKMQNPEATKLYDNIYSLFIEGKFDEALAQKKTADSTYGQNYWTPQLLYIEAVYHVKQRNDSAARVVLTNISTLYPGTLISVKANNLAEVLKRRAEIEKYLTDLQVTRVPEDGQTADDKPVVKTQPPVVSKPVVTAVPTVTQPVAVKPVTADTTRKAAGIDTVRKVPPDTVKKKLDSVKKIMPPLSNGAFTLAPNAVHYVMMILDKVDPVYEGEAKNAFDRFNRENFSGLPIEITKDGLDAERRLLLFASFASSDMAVQYYERVKRAAAQEVSWLPAAKYSFMIITSDNLQILKTNKDITGYKKLLNTQYPGKF